MEKTIASRKVVLVVEDEFLIREDTADILASDGFEVMQAAAAEEALDLIVERPEISVLFTDVNLPGMNGLALARQVLNRWPHIRVLVTSGHINPKVDEIPGEFIGKPYMPEMVVATVRELAGA